MPRKVGGKGIIVMLEIIQMAGLVLAFGVALIITSDAFALAVSRVVEAAFDGAEYRLALRARSRSERIKSRRREERRRATRVSLGGLTRTRGESSSFLILSLRGYYSVNNRFSNSSNRGSERKLSMRGSTRA